MAIADKMLDFKFVALEQHQNLNRFWKRFPKNIFPKYEPKMQLKPSLIQNEQWVNN